MSQSPLRTRSFWLTGISFPYKQRMLYLLYPVQECDDSIQARSFESHAKPIKDLVSLLLGNLHYHRFTFSNTVPQGILQPDESSMSPLALDSTIHHETNIQRKPGCPNRIKNTYDVRSAPLIFERVLSYQQRRNLSS